MPDPAHLSPSTRRRSQGLRRLGAALLLLGLAAAGVIYWVGSRTPDIMNDPSMVGFDKARTRQMGELYGPMGLVFKGIMDDLRRPANQATLIAVLALIAFAVFRYAAGLVERHGERGADG